MWKYTTVNELSHTGVIGMRWGVRRAQKKGKNYTYKSRDTKLFERAAQKAKSQEKAKKYSSIAKKNAEHDKSMQAYATSLTKSQAFIRTVLLGGLGHRSYASLLASGVSKKAAVVGSILFPVNLSYLVKVHRSVD